VDIYEAELAYISPEQTGRLNRTIDYRTDYYSLGVGLYQMLTCHLPFEMEDPMEVVHSQIARQPVPPHYLRPDAPVCVSEVIMKLLLKKMTIVTKALTVTF
jgi:serine/threonine protein kinase